MSAVDSPGGEDAFPSVSDSPVSPSRPAVRPHEPAESKNNSHGQGWAFTVLPRTLGVVYGDIGTSPLYTIKECFYGLHAIPPSETNIMGVLSLVFWSLTVVVSIKYVLLLLRTDNKGEGGVYALLGLIPEDGNKISARTGLRWSSSALSAHRPFTGMG